MLQDECIAKIEHQLKEIRERLEIFQPETGGQEVMNSDEWKCRVSDLVKSYRCVADLIEQVKQRATTHGSLTSRDSIRTQALLDKVEATVLNASGLLFNVHTALDFFAVDGIFKTVVEKGCADKSICLWSSGVFPLSQTEGFCQETLQYCLRSPPTVQKILSMVEKDMAVSVTLVTTQV